MGIHEDILAALLAKATAAASGAEVRLADPPDDFPDVPAAGLVMLADEGMKAEDAEFGAGFAVYDVQHFADVLIMAATAARAAQLRVAISAAILSDTSLGGIADSVMIGNADKALEGGDGVTPIHSFSFPVMVMTTSANPLA